MNITRPLPVSIAVRDNRIDNPKELLDREYADVDELMNTLARVTHGTRPEREPAAFIGREIFSPETASFNLDTNQDGSSSNAVNYILRSGQEYRIPVLCTTKGLFLATGVRLTLWMRFMDKQSGVNVPIQLLMPAAPVQFEPGHGGFGTYGVYWTTKFACMPKQPQLARSGSVFGPTVNYVWSIQDDMRWSYPANGMFPASQMLNRAYVDPLASGARDGDAHRFDASFLMRRNTTLTFVLRPVTDVVQFDSSISGTNAAIGLAFDDRENGRRNQAVTAQVDILGERVGDA